MTPSQDILDPRSWVYWPVKFLDNIPRLDFLQGRHTILSIGFWVV